MKYSRIHSKVIFPHGQCMLHNIYTNRNQILIYKADVCVINIQLMNMDFRWQRLATIQHCNVQNSSPGNLTVHKNTDGHEKEEEPHREKHSTNECFRDEALWIGPYQQRSTFLQEIIFRQSQREHEVNASGDNGCLFHPRHFHVPRITPGQHWPTMNETPSSNLAAIPTGQLKHERSI